MNLSYVYAELRRRPGRTLASVLSVAVGVALFVSLQAYAAGYREAARAPLAQIGADIVAQRQGTVPEAFEGVLFPHSTAPIHQSEIDAIRKLPGVEDVGQAVFFWDFEPNSFLVGLGLDPGQTVGPGRLRTAVRAGRFLQPGDQGVAVADSSFASQNHLAVDDQVTVAGKPFILVGLVDTSRAGQLANANLYLPLADAQALSTAAPNVRAVFDFRADDANILFVKANATRATAIADEVKGILGNQAIVTTPGSFNEVLGSTFDLIDRFGLLVGLAGLLIAMAGLLRTTAASLWERRRDVGLMRAVGWRRRDVAGQLLAETLVLTALGGLIGLAVAQLVSFGLGFSRVTVPVPWELSPTPHFLPGGAEAMAVTVNMDARIDPIVILASLTLAFLGGALVSLGMARRASNIKPAEVLRGE
jgi:ABC-type antimicrobial peptide transport system permease subunit